MTDYTPLEELAKKALTAAVDMAAHQKATHGRWPAWCDWCAAPAAENERTNRALFATANPQTILALIAELREARTKLNTARSLSDLDTEHLHECDLCAGLLRSTQEKQP